VNSHRATTAAAVWQPGERVTLRGRTWTVAGHTAYADCEALHLDAADGEGSRTFLLPFDRPRRAKPKPFVVVSARRWLRAFAGLLLRTHPYGGLRRFSRSIDIVPRQLEPALSVLRDGHPRLLVADDVGMGKTIEAGVILSELAGRDPSFRALILVPAGLKEQWRQELASRFAAAPAVADACWLRQAARLLPPDVNPWSPPGTYIASFDFIKRPEALRPLEDVRWDLVVVDEAHAAAGGTDRRAAVDAVASRASRVVLLTATPPGDPAELTSLCEIGAAPHEGPIPMFQRRRRDGDRPLRRSVLLAIRLTAKERRMHRLLERYTAQLWRAARRLGDGNVRLATVLLRKRALSSAASLACSLRRRLELLSEAGADSEFQLRLPLDPDGENTPDDIVDEGVLGVRGLEDLAHERRWLDVLIGAADAASESKTRVLVRLLSRIGEPALVFTEYRDTLEHLHAALAGAGVPTGILHGGLTHAERRDAVARFTRGCGTLLATDAAAEGLNLQHACRLVVHYELPWNPARILQRAGRLDRMGQPRRVHEIAFVAADTAESVVLAPLTRRALRWQAAHDTARMLALLTESRVADAVFDGIPPAVLAVPPAASPAALVSLETEGRAEAERLAAERALRRAPPAEGVFTVPVAAVRRRQLPSGVLLCFELETAERGVVHERTLAVLHASVSIREWRVRRRDLKARVCQLLPALLSVTSATVERLARDQTERMRPRFAQAADRLRRREQSIRDVHASAARRLAQAGLFERRGPQRLERSASELLDDETAGANGHETSRDLVTSVSLRAVLVVRGG
jgi:superfamily II DNA or RNA helicase